MGSCCKKKSSRLERLSVRLYKYTFYSYKTNFETVNLSYNDEHFVLVMKKVSGKSQTRIMRLYYHSERSSIPLASCFRCLKEKQKEKRFWKRDIVRCD